MTTAKPVALVTGASSGIGKAAAIALVEAGFEVVGTSRNTSRVAPLDGVTFLDLDVTSDESVSTAVGRCSIGSGGSMSWSTTRAPAQPGPPRKAPSPRTSASSISTSSGSSG